MEKKDKVMSTLSQSKKEITKVLKNTKEGDYFLFIHYPADKTKDNRAIIHANVKREAINMCVTLAAHLSRED
jgi:hypothetical protein